MTDGTPTDEELRVRTEALRAKLAALLPDSLMELGGERQEIVPADDLAGLEVEFRVLMRRLRARLDQPRIQ
jgi:hypothetical protein